MKVGLLVEGRTDRLAFGVLLERLLDSPIDVIEYRRRASGITGVLESAHRACWHFRHQGADGIVLAVDNDDAVPTHHPGHGGTEHGCRTCLLTAAVPELPQPRPRVAVAVPVQAIESWLLFARGEARPEGVDRRTLKQRVFGSPRPGPAAVDQVTTELLTKVDLAELGAAAPSFERFATQVRAWPV